MLFDGAPGYRRKAEESRRPTDWASALVQFSGEAIIGVGPGGIVTSWNPAAAKLYGYTNEEILGKSVLLTTPESHIEESRAVLAKVSAGQPVEHLETIRVRKDGTLFPVSLTVAPIFDEDGAIVGAAAIASDLTQLRQGVESAQRLATFLEHSDDAIIGQTLEGIMTSWNPAAQRMYGYDSEEVIGKPIELLAPAERADEMKAVLAEIGTGYPVEHFESVRLRKDGTEFPAAIVVSPILENEVVIGASTMVRDLTENRYAYYVRSLIEAGLDPLVNIGADGKINDVNEATIRATGVLREELIGTEFSQYFTEPDKAHDGYLRAFAQGSVANYPLTIRHRDGTLTEVSCNAAVYRDAAGKALGLFAAARDVTCLQRAERDLDRMVARLESANAAVMGETDAVIGGTLEGIITSWNPGAARMFGYSRQEMIGQTFRLLVPKDRSSEMAAIEAKVRDGQASELFESVRVRRDGSTFPVSITNSPITDADGTVIGVSTIVRDLTAKKRDQREIADWRAKAFRWMEELEQSQRLSVMREFERELEVIDLLAEIERLRHPAPPDRAEPEDEH